MIEFEKIQKGDKTIIRVKAPHTIFQLAQQVKKSRRNLAQYLKQAAKNQPEKPTNETSI